MRHYMKLKSHPFYMIRSGQKTFELRLYDEKRQQLKVNDEIEFCCLDRDESPFAVRVIALHHFNSFTSLESSTAFCASAPFAYILDGFPYLSVR